MWSLIISIVVTVIAGFVAYFVVVRNRELIFRFRRIVWRNIDHKSFSAALHPVLPLSAAKGWTLLGAANGKRQWMKIVPSLSENCPVFATHSIIETSPRDVIVTLCDTLQQPDWDPFTSKVNIVMTPSSHDGVQSDIVKVVQIGSGNSCTITRCWRFSDSGCCWLLSAHVDGCLGDAKWSYWKADPIETEGLDGFSVVTLFVGSSYPCYKPPNCLSAWLRSLQQHVTLKQCEMNYERTEPPNPVVVVASGKESNDEKSSTTTASDTKVIKLSSFPSPATQAKSHIKHPVLDNERQRWVSLCDESAQTVQRVAISTVTQGWEYVDQQKGVIIMKKPSESGDGRSLNRVKGTAVIKAPPFFVISYIGHFEKSKQWNEMFDHGEIIEQITPSTRITHLAYKSVFPATARDFCVVSGIRQLDKHTFIHAASSVKHPKCGAEKSFVRAETMAGGFAIIRDERNLEQCSVTYTTCVDLKGRVPTFVINKVSTSQPMCVAVLRDLVERDYNTLRNEQKRKWQNMTLMNYLRRGETGGDDDIDAEAGEDVKGYDIVLEEDEKESEWMDASGQVTESSFDGSISISQTMSMEESVCAMPHDVDLPLTFESEIDYRTLGNQVCGDIMAEFLLAATVDLHSPKRQSSNGWMFQYVEKDVQILKKSLPNCKFNSFIGKGIINLPPAVVWAAVKDPQTRFVYDNMLKTLDIVERIEPGLMIVYTIHETANCFMKQARDLCYLHCEREDPSGKYIVAGRSVEHPKCPGKPSLVRAHAYPSGWQIEPLKQDGRTVSLVSCLVQVNLGGMVPSRLLNMVAKRQPLSVAYIREYLTSS